MHTDIPKEFTFTSCFNEIHSSCFTNYKAEVNLLLKQLNLLNYLPFQTQRLFYIYDFVQRKFLMLSPSIRNILGYDANDFLSGGLLKLFQLFHKDDYKIFNEKIFPANIQFLKKQPSSEHARFIFSHNNRVLNKSGDWLHLFIKNLYITYPNTALPHLNFVLAVDITDHKQDNLIVHRIDEEILSEHSLNKPIVINYYFPDNNEIHLSKQERKILGCLSEGLNSKQIAQRLHLSESTIINHRKNIQKKTSTKNVAELISFAFRNKILK